MSQITGGGRHDDRQNSASIELGDGRGFRAHWIVAAVFGWLRCRASAADVLHSRIYFREAGEEQRGEDEPIAKLQTLDSSLTRGRGNLHESQCCDCPI